jgi:bifunctional non-homologous end joining protein LigD
MEFDISHPEKLIFTRYTKKSFVRYYDQIADVMLPHIEQRLLTLYRFPEGADKEGFFQKDKPDYFPEWIDHRLVRKDKGAVDYVVCNTRESLVYLASQVAEFHIWTSRVEKLGYPDKMVFDLDPSGGNLSLLKSVLRKLEKLLTDIGLNPFLMATGKRGYHVVVPIRPEQSNVVVREFTLKVAMVLEQDDPRHLTTELLKEKRKRRMFLDVNRNSPHQTSVAPYSVRAVMGASVALPLEWTELPSVNPGDYDIGRTLRRMQRRSDPWEDFRQASVSLKKVIDRLKK